MLMTAPCLLEGRADGEGGSGATQAMADRMDMDDSVDGPLTSSHHRGPDPVSTCPHAYAWCLLDLVLRLLQVSHLLALSLSRAGGLQDVGLKTSPG